MIQAWGVPLYTSKELLSKFKNSSLWPDTSGDTVVVVGADTFVYAKATKKLNGDKLYLVVDTPIVCRGAGLELNGVNYLLYGRWSKGPLKKKPPTEGWKLPNLNAGDVLKRNAKRVHNLVKANGKILKAEDFNGALRKTKAKLSDKRKASAKPKETVDAS